MSSSAQGSRRTSRACSRDSIAIPDLSSVINTHKMCAKIIFTITLFSLIMVFVNSATFDQRQTGESNVQVDLKHLQIIALLKGGKEEYVDYDYAYDYSEMTIKPQNGTTPKPLNSTSTAIDTMRDNHTVASTAITEQTTLPIKFNNSQSLETSEITWFPAVNESTTTVKTLEIVTTEPSEFLINKNESSLPVSETPSSPTNCKKGFVINQRGDCELKLNSAGNALMKLVKLSQKLKLRRENRRNGDQDCVTIACNLKLITHT